jgi:hypothetical protein
LVRTQIDAREKLTLLHPLALLSSLPEVPSPAMRGRVREGANRVEAIFTTRKPRALR